MGGGVAEGVIADDGGLAGGEGVDVGAENLLGLDFFFEDLRARLGIVGGGDDGVDSSVKRSRAEIGAEGDSEARRRGTFCGRRLRCGAELRMTPRAPTRPTQTRAMQKRIWRICGWLWASRCEYFVAQEASRFIFFETCLHVLGTATFVARSPRGNVCVSAGRNEATESREKEMV